MISMQIYRPDRGSKWLKTCILPKGRTYADLSEVDSRYRYFGVGIELVVDNTTFVSKGRLVMAVDVGLSILHVGKRIASGLDASFDFTEESEVIGLSCDCDLVVVTSSARDEVATAGRAEAVECFSSFVSGVYDMLVGEFPGLEANLVMRRLGRGLDEPPRVW